MEIILYSVIMEILIWPIIIIGLLIFFLARHKNKKHSLQSDKWYLNISFSKEDAVSQLFLLLSLIFFGITLLSFNRDIGNLFSWRTILLIISALGLISAYYFKIIYTFIFSLIGLVWWWIEQAGKWSQINGIKSSAVLVGLAFAALLSYIVGRLHEKKIKLKRFALVYLTIGMLSVSGILFFFSTKIGIISFNNMTDGTPFFKSWQITLSLIILALSIIGTTIYSTIKKLISPLETATASALLTLFSIIAFLPKQNLFIHNHGLSLLGRSSLSGTGIFWALTFNFTAVLALLGLIFWGYSRREDWIINLSAFFLFLLIIVEYFNWFFTLLNRSIFFIGAGILFFVVGWLMEKGRRRLLKEMESESQQIL